MRTLVKKTVLTAVALLLAGASAMAYEERGILEKKATREMVRNSLIMDQKWIPYPQSYNDRQGWDEFFGPFKQSLIKHGESRLGCDWKVVKTSYYLEYARTGNRTIMESPFMENMNSLGILFSAELAEGKGRFIDDIIDGVVNFCEMTSWSLSAHLAALSKTKSAVPDETEDILELFQGNLSQLLSWTYYYFHDEFDKITPIVSRRLRHELQVRELDPYMARDDFWWMGWKTAKGQPINNWNPWCNSNALLCFMLLENDRDKLADAVYKSMLSTDKYINWVTADGACEEGPSYWPAAPGMMFEYLDALDKITGGKVSIYDNKLIKDMGEYIVYSCIGNGYMVNFADASVRAGVNPQLTYRYGKATGSSLMMSFAAEHYKKTLKSGEDVNTREAFAWTTPLRGFESVKASRELAVTDTQYHFNPSIWYPATEFCYLDNGNGWFAAMKGGHNNESHNHNDVGTISLFIDKIPVLIDAGVGTYTKKTFSSERYAIWTMQSQYHNLPSINSVMEHQGEEYRSRAVKADVSKGMFSLDIAGAYPKEACVKTWRRSYQLNRNSLRIEDSFELSETKAPNIINFMTCGNVDISKEGKVTIETEGKRTLLSYDPKVFSPEIEKITIDDNKLKKEWGDELIRIKLISKDKTRKGTYRYVITGE